MGAADPLEKPRYEPRKVAGLPVDFVVSPQIHYTSFEAEVLKPKAQMGTMRVAVDLLHPLDTEEEYGTDDEGEDSEDGTPPKGEGDVVQERRGHSGLDGATVDVAAVDG